MKQETKSGSKNETPLKSNHQRTHVAPGRFTLSNHIRYNHSKTCIAQKAESNSFYVRTHLAKRADFKVAEECVHLCQAVVQDQTWTTA